MGMGGQGKVFALPVRHEAAHLTRERKVLIL